MEKIWIIWTIIAGISFLLEILTVGFFMFWVGVGAIIALIISLFALSINIQVGFFVTTTILMIIFTKPLVNKYIKTKKIPTNVDAITGKVGIVIEEIDGINGKGQIKVEGETWGAISEDGEKIPLDTKIEIVTVKGVKLVVKIFEVKE